MKKPVMQQKTERRISAGLRLLLVALLLLAQVAVVILLSELLQQQMALVYTALELTAVVVAIWVYTRPGGSSSYKVAWALLILAVPVAGLVLYVLWGGGARGKRLSLKKVPRIPDDSEAVRRSSEALFALSQMFPQWQCLAQYTDRRGFRVYGGTRAEYLDTGAAYFRHMLKSIEQAQKFIFLEYYILTRGEIFDRLMEIFRRKREQGVEIKIIFDDFGSMMRFGGEEVAALRRIGVEVKVFNPVHHYVNRLYFNYRNHRKITCIDGDLCYTGGVNIADEYAGIFQRFGYWKDCGVCLQGEGAWSLTREFLQMWQRLGGTLSRPPEEYRPRVIPEGVGFCQPFADGPDNNPVNAAEDIFLHLIARARHSLRITTPYLAIDEPMLRALCIAGDSGVKVQLMLPGIPDHKFAYLVAETYFGELLRHGVELYTFNPGLLHGKTLLVDDEVAVVGSVNMDYRSFQLHFECGAVLYGTEVNAPLSRDMDDIIAHSHRITMEDWNGRKWHRKALGLVLRLFAMWM